MAETDKLHDFTSGFCMFAVQSLTNSLHAAYGQGSLMQVPRLATPVPDQEETEGIKGGKRERHVTRGVWT